MNIKNESPDLCVFIIMIFVFICRVSEVLMVQLVFLVQEALKDSPYVNSLPHTLHIDIYVLH